MRPIIYSLNTIDGIFLEVITDGLSINIWNAFAITIDNSKDINMAIAAEMEY